jgi:predicted DNA-binding transcriptional regulator AlpA
MDRNSLKDNEAAEYIGMSVSFLRQSRVNGDRRNYTSGPNYIRIGRAIRYLVADLDDWLEMQRVPMGR